MFARSTASRPVPGVLVTSDGSFWQRSARSWPACCSPSPCSCSSLTRLTPTERSMLDTTAGSWVLTATQALFFAGMAAWPLMAAWRKSAGWRHAYGFVVSWRAVGIGLAGGVVTLIAMTVLTSLTAELLNQEVTSAGADAAESMTGSTVAFVFFLLLIAVGAPFVEELAFRGLVWGAAVKRGWSPWVATLIAGVPFALLHVEPLQGCAAACSRDRAGRGASIRGVERRDARALRREHHRRDRYRRLVSLPVPSCQDGAANPPVGSWAFCPAERWRSLRVAAGGATPGAGRRARRGSFVDLGPTSALGEHDTQEELSAHASGRWRRHLGGHLVGERSSDCCPRIRIERARSGEELPRAQGGSGLQPAQVERRCPRLQAGGHPQLGRRSVGARSRTTMVPAM